MSVRVEHFTRRFTSGGAAAVDDVSFNAPDGAITSLLGPSGSGKTTVLRMIAGLEEPDGGRVYFQDQEMTRVPVRRRGVGFVFQGYALFHNMTVADNVAFGLEVQRLSRSDIQARVRELLELVQLEELAKRYPRQLSGGQQQRVAFARALATRPKVLLLDEPFGALDAKVRVELRDWLARLHERTHVTTILVTHDQDEALELSEHVVVMNEGRVEQAGAPHDLYDRPATPFVASFLGGANVLRGRVQGGRVSIGQMSLQAPAPDGAQEGASLHAFVRPHDVRIARAPAEGEPAHAEAHAGVELARVARLVRVGGLVKLDLQLSSDEIIAVERPRAEIDSLGIAEGDRVIVDLRDASIFVEDYAI